MNAVILPYRSSPHGNLVKESSFLSPAPYHLRKRRTGRCLSRSSMSMNHLRRAQSGTPAPSSSGGVPKSECKGTHFSNNHQNFRTLFCIFHQKKCRSTGKRRNGKVYKGNMHAQGRGRGLARVGVRACARAVGQGTNGTIRLVLRTHTGGQNVEAMRKRKNDKDERTCGTLQGIF